MDPRQQPTEERASDNRWPADERRRERGAHDGRDAHPPPVVQQHQFLSVSLYMAGSDKTFIPFLCYRLFSLSSFSLNKCRF